MVRQLVEYHSTIGYRFIPGLRARMQHEGGGFLIRVNKAGFRCDHEFESQKPRGKRRILLFGDSFTAGDGVSNGQRYGDLIEQQVSDVEVYNFGLPGTGTDQHYLAYREFAKGIDHDLLIIAVLVENIRRVASHYRYTANQRGAKLCLAKPYYELLNSELLLRNVPVPRKLFDESTLPQEERAAIDRGGRLPAVRRLINSMGLKEVVQKVTRYQPVPEYNKSDNPVWLVMRRILETWIHGHDKSILLVPIPLYQFIEETSDPTAYRMRFREVCAATGCALHDPLDDLRRYPMGIRRKFRFAKDIHLTQQGHITLADSLVPVVSRLLG